MEQDFVFFEKWVYNQLDMDLSAYKSKQLHRRISSIMDRSGYNNLKEYAKAISKDETLRSKFLDYITINVSEFFRNKIMFDDLEAKIKENLLSQYPALKIWSAACSIGAEPYSLAIILDKISKGKRHHILATDIDDKIIGKAKEGVYRAEEVKNVSPEDLKAYFEEKDGKYYINEDIKGKVTFKKHDLILGNYEKNFHLILCRNVVIYFKSQSKKEIYEKFHDSLVPGGLLFVGATETIFNSKELGFEKIANFLYQKIE